jgi:hypothetical protein
LAQLDANERAHVELLLFQYRECWSDIQHFNTLVWQIPSVTTIIAGVLAAISSTTMLTIRIVLFTIALSLTFVMTIAFHKNQFFMVYRFREMEKIEVSLGKLGIALIAKGDRSTNNIKKEIAEGTITNMPKGWFYDRTAYNWIRSYMYLLMIALALGFIFTII